jgi:photosystem II stability/assembly factor-like uncharacterized protein
MRLYVARGYPTKCRGFWFGLSAHPGHGKSGILDEYNFDTLTHFSELCIIADIMEFPTRGISFRLELMLSLMKKSFAIQFSKFGTLGCMITSFLILSFFPVDAQVDSLYMGTMYFRDIGPANQGGRIVDVEAVPGQFRKVYVAVGSGGVWKSENAGTTWVPIFDHYETASIGDIAIDPNDSDVLWVGTGEANNRNSVSWGNGIYRTTDGGESFEHLGLSSTHHISRVLVNPENSSDVCVCATGHLWGYSGERGIFHSTDAGKSWTRLKGGLPEDGKTGCTDLVRDPRNPDVLYAAMYHRLRKPWRFQSGGEQGGIYKSADGGKSWKKLTTGLPAGPTGRIGLDIYQKNPDVLMALVEAERVETTEVPGSGLYRTDNGGESWTFVNTYNNRPFYYSQVRINPFDDQRVYLLTTTFMVSDDGGKNLRNGSPDYEVHGDYHAMWLDPKDKDRYYLGADKGLSLTHDHGQHFQLFDNFAIGQFYRINYDMRDPYYVYGGFQDNGTYATASFSRDARGILNDSNWKLHWGDGQYININPYDWRDMYSSTENGSYTKYDPKTHRIERITPGPNTILNFEEVMHDTVTDMASAFRFNWSAPLIMSPHNPDELYVAGNYVLYSADKGKSWTAISPDISSNDPDKRKQGISGGITPDNTGAETHCAATTLSISPVDAQIIWVGTDDGNIQLTTDHGVTWTDVRGNVPDVPEGIWVSRIESSHFDRSRAYVTFDGHRSDHFETWVFKTEDFGESWERIVSGITAGEVARVIREDVINENLLFLGTETGLWRSLDQGGSWSRMSAGLPTVSVYDLKIHPRDHDLIVGTHGRSLWIMDDISPLQQFTGDVMASDFHLFEQRRATIWENVSRGGQRGHFWYAGQNPATIENTSNVPRAEFRNLAAISFFVSPGHSDSLTLTISNLAGTMERKVVLPAKEGFQRYYWDLEYDQAMYTSEEFQAMDEIFKDLLSRFNFRSQRRLYNRFKNATTGREQRRAVSELTVPSMAYSIPDEYLHQTAGPGVYRVTLTSGGASMTTSLDVREDPLITHTLGE